MRNFITSRIDKAISVFLLQASAASPTVQVVKFLLLLLTLLVAETQPVRAQEGLGSAGAFMRLGIGARAGSLGDAYVAAASGPEAIYWNPAATALDPTLQFALTQRRYAFDRNFSFAGVLLPVGENNAVGLAWTGFRTAGLEARSNNTATPDALFSDEENAFSATFGHRLSSRFYAGLTATFINQKLFDRTANGYAAGMSALYKPNSTLAFGLALQDIFSSFKWNANAVEKLPATLRTGLAWQFTPLAMLTLDYQYVGPKNIFNKDWWGRKGRVRAGTELRTLRSLPLRFGYSASGFNAGAGFEVPVSSSLVALDYQYGVQDGLGNNGHAFSVRIDFGHRRRLERAGDSDFNLRKQELANASRASSTKNSTPQEKTASANVANASRIETAQRRTNRTTSTIASSSVASGTWLTISSEQLDVHTGPGSNYKLLGRVYRGGRYEVLRWRDTWFQIRWNGNQLGWIKANFISKKKMAGR